jgi:formylmethanofuran dehydrogenase subunit E
VTHNTKVASLIEKAAELHGHLGPFLVLGVRMGEVAEKHLDLDNKNRRLLKTSIRTPLFPPFSCVIDGVQASTSCTIGNQRLKIEESAKEITARFKLPSSGRTVKISVKPEVVESLIKEMPRLVDAEMLAAKVAHMPEEQLFVVEA